MEPWTSRVAQRNSICISSADSAFSEINNFLVRESKIYKCRCEPRPSPTWTNEQLSAGCLLGHCGGCRGHGLQHMPFLGTVVRRET